MQGDDYYGIDEDLCYFYENGWEDRLTKAVEKPFEAYLGRHPEILEKRREKKNEQIEENCP